jgi:peroxiredoxin
MTSISVLTSSLKILLATAFLAAGVSKMADRRGFQKALLDFGVSNKVLGPLAVSLPPIELAVGLLLFVPKSAFWGSISALFLLSIFTAVLATTLVRGKRPVCHCFGQFNSKPIGWPTIARNVLFVICAAFILKESGSSNDQSALKLAVTWLDRFLIYPHVGLVVVLIVLTQSWLLLNLMRQHGRLLIRIDALEGEAIAQNPRDGSYQRVGLPAPSFELFSLSGEHGNLESLLKIGKPVVLCFVEPQCAPCNALLPNLARWDQYLLDELTLVLISRGAVDENRTKFVPFNFQNILIQKDREVSDKYEVNGTPCAVLINPSGTIGSHLAAGPAAIVRLVSEIKNRKMNVRDDQGLTVGTEAQYFKLPDLRGQWVSLPDFLGFETMILFWNPNCGFCSKMLSELRNLKEKLAEGSQKLLIISVGRFDEDDFYGIRSSILLDERSTVGAAYGVKGTPSAIIVDSKGKIKSGIAIGAANIFGLAAQNINFPSKALAEH